MGAPEMVLTEHQIKFLIGSNVSAWIGAGADPDDVRRALFLLLERWDALDLPGLQAMAEQHYQERVLTESLSPVDRAEAGLLRMRASAHDLGQTLTAHPEALTAEIAHGLRMFTTSLARQLGYGLIEIPARSSS